MYFIEPPSGDIKSALETWEWLPIQNKTPVRVTAFADVFMQGEDGIWFLDSIEGSLRRVCSTAAELEEILQTEDGQDEFLLAGFVDRAVKEGLILATGECYDFRINPVLGGAMEYENIEKQNFIVALNMAGQIHQQTKDLPAGTKITNITVDRAMPVKRPWWKFW